MNVADKEVINAAMLDLVTKLRITTKFKAAFVSELILPDDIVDQLFSSALEEENITFQMLTQLKKADQDAFDKFLRVLRLSGQGGLADNLLKRKEDKIKPGKPLKQGNADGESTVSSEGSVASSKQESFTSKLSRRSQTATTEPNTHSSPTMPTVTTGLRERVQEILPPKGYSPQVGDVVVLTTFTRALYGFSDGDRDSLPHTFKNLEERNSHSNGSIVTMPPGSCAQLCRIIGGQSKHLYQKRNDRNVFVKMDMTIDYVMVKIFFQPNGQSLGGWWFQSDTTMMQALECSLGWSPVRARNHGHLVRDIDMDEKVVDWWRDTTTTSIDVWSENS